MGLRPITPDRFCAHLVAELPEFTPDPHAAPARVFAGKALASRDLRRAGGRVR